LLCRRAAKTGRPLVEQHEGPDALMQRPAKTKPLGHLVHDGDTRGLVSWYSSHEGSGATKPPCSIYLAELSLPAGA